MRASMLSVAVLIGFSVLVVSVSGQDQKPVDATPSVSTEKKPAELEKTIEALQAQVAALRQQVQTPSAQDQNERAKAIYNEVFSKARDQAGPACKAAGGHLLVSVDLQASKATIACEWK